MKRQMDRRRFLASTGAAAAALAATPHAEAKAKRANVVLIMADDLGYETLGCNGSASYKTPHLDELARTGARFTHCYSQPLCTPTRVQIMTGRYSFRNYTRFGTLRQGEHTFAHMARDAGYVTGCFGKWQLAGGGGQTAPQAGFENFCLWNYPGLGRARYADPFLAWSDPQAGQVVRKQLKGAYGPDVVTRHLCDFVRRAVKAGKPFLAYYPMILTHDPFTATPDSTAWKANPHASGRPFFRDMVAYMDTLVGRIVATLDELGVREDTLLAFLGDNGTHATIASKMRDGQTLRGDKGLPTDGGTHVPLVVHWRGTIAAGQVRDDLVDTTDFLPTIAEAISATPRKPPGDGVLDGRSFLPQLTGREAALRKWVLVDYTEPRQDGFGWPRARSIRDRRWKLYGYSVCWPRKGGERIVRTGHLYDVAADPGERKPILPAADSPETAAARRRLQAALESLDPPPVKDPKPRRTGKAGR